MNSTTILSFIISTILMLVNSETTSSHLNGYQLLRINATKESVNDFKHFLNEWNETADVWKEVSDDEQNIVLLDILASPLQIQALKSFNEKEKGFSIEVLQDDIMGLLEKEAQSNQIEDVDLEGRPVQDIRWNKYYDLEVMYDYMDMLESTYPFKDLIVVEEIGKSYEGRSIKMAKIHNYTEDSKAGNSRRRIFIDGGTHAREWISSGVALYIIYLLVERHDDYEDLINQFEWLIVPVVNPDGYEYSRKRDRMWRKSRRRNDKSSCKGVDLNRNYDFHWKEGGNLDELSNPCSNIFAGSSPFSEPETQAIQRVIIKYNQTIEAYFSLHSYGQLWTFPWSYKSPDRGSPEYYNLYVAAERAVNALKSRHGTPYIFGSSSELSYASSGTSDDWAFGAMGISLSFTIELRDEGPYGFLLPPSYIVPTAEETLDGMKALLTKD